MNAMIRSAALWMTVGASTWAAAADPSIAIYTALYQAEYKGKNVGTSEFAVSYDSQDDVYEFTSRTLPKGFIKLVTPNPVVERSRFRVDGGTIRPLEFWYEDGSRKGEDNQHVLFEWERNVAIVDGDGGRREVRLEAGVLDRGSMQVALMRDLAATGAPGKYLLADGDSLKAYEYADNGEHTVTTGIGAVATRSFVQRREGSSRTTWLWVAPELAFLPVRIEQRRDGEVQSAFTLTSVEGLARAQP
jgi:hypothetical protein